MTRTTITRPERRSKTKSSSNSIRTYRSAINYLDSLVNWERVISPNYNSNNFGLARISRILAALGNPHRKFKAAHVAGTKGKGSTVAMLAEMVRACAIKVGVYTSPHLLDVRERIMVDGEIISENAFAKAVSAVAGVMTKAKVTSPTYFEVLTAAAFKHFADSGVELAVVETGLGGRLDATNVVQPDVVGLTSISFDHVAQLGNSLEAIAKEKAGIIKKGVPVVSAPQRDNVKQVFTEAAQQHAAPLRFSDENVDFSYRFEFSRAAGRHARICLTTENSKFEHVQVPLLGEHQAINCTLALNMLDVLKTRGYAIDDQLAVQGLDKVNLPGRMQMINENPRILIDGAHNAASIDALMRAIGQNITYDSMVVIFACHRDKDISGMIKRLQLGADKMIFTSTGTPRSAEPAELAAQYMEISGKMTQVADTLDDAMQIALRAVSREDIICITGSFYLIAQAARKYNAARGAVELAAV
jgi:dihydrofolate synthase / folylpolyglutamate synthase